MGERGSKWGGAECRGGGQNAGTGVGVKGSECRVRGQHAGAGEGVQNGGALFRDRGLCMPCRGTQG